MLQLEFDTWQLVRVMVYLEEQDAKNELLKRWGDIWQDLDKKLAKLSESDFEAFSDLMMNQNVVFEEVAKDDLKQVLKAIDGVIVQMKGVMKTQKLEGMQKDNLDFEIAELQSLRRSFKLLA
ncbi:MAG: hypothetical protein OQK35_00865 [Alphaproteobacteria bacterium]|nr:hypothetical protein [Rhodospirillales bacterium]MCW9044860.1 hypothetical protein [Alphaproteobacteria bacterium]